LDHLIAGLYISADLDKVSIATPFLTSTHSARLAWRVSQTSAPLLSPRWSSEQAAPLSTREPAIGPKGTCLATANRPVQDVQLDGHRARLLIERMRDPCDGPRINAIGISGDMELHFGALRNAATSSSGSATTSRRRDKS